MKYKQMNQVNKEEETVEVKKREKAKNVMTGMAWVKVWLRWMGSRMRWRVRRKMTTKKDGKQ